MGRSSKPSLDEVSQQTAAQTLQTPPKRFSLRKFLPFFGPAFVASVAYMDPGNFAVNIEGGAQFGYLLLWVILLSNLLGMFFQAMSAKLGLATGKNLAELCRERYSKKVSLSMWIGVEIVAMATDLAELLGAAIGFQLLFHLPLFWGGMLTAGCTFALLALQRYGFRPIELVVTALVGLVGVAYGIEMVLCKPDWSAVGTHLLVPGFEGGDSMLLAVGILGATVMPHVIFLHSALTQGRIVTRDAEKMRRLYRYERIDIAVALGIAGLINAAILIVSAAAFHQPGAQVVGTLEEAHQALTPVLGQASSVLFGGALLVSGISSSAVGTWSGQVIMRGFVNWETPVWLRRLVTLVPALAAIALGLEPTITLVMSQVVLSFGLPLALIPLLQFTADRSLMGVLTNSAGVNVLLRIAVVLIVALNLTLVVYSILGG